jgi:large subunit ribosomal protein L3
VKALLATKIGMSQVFTPEGIVIPVTLVTAEPNKVLLRRTAAKDGYTAVQLGLPSGKNKRPFTARREVELSVAEDVSEVTVEQFVVGDRIEVIGVSKGKGFQGVVKRHHFKGGPASHGHTDWERKAGSIGARFPQHTRKGMRMAGRMGGDQVTVKNLEVVVVDAANKLLAIKGAVPGKRGSVLVITASI